MLNKLTPEVIASLGTSKGAMGFVSYLMCRTADDMRQHRSVPLTLFLLARFDPASCRPFPQVRILAVMQPAGLVSDVEVASLVSDCQAVGVVRISLEPPLTTKPSVVYISLEHTATTPIFQSWAAPISWTESGPTLHLFEPMQQEALQLLNIRPKRWLNLTN